MDGDMLLEATLADSRLHSGLDTARQERVGGEELVRPASGRKEPGRMPMGAPVGAEEGEQGRGERDEAVLAAFALLDMDTMRALSIWEMRRLTPSPRRKPAA